MSQSSNLKPTPEILQQWPELAQKINDELNAKEAEGWLGPPDNGTGRLAMQKDEELWGFISLTQQITRWCDSGGCNVDPTPLVETQKLLLQRSRYDKCGALTEIYEESIPDAYQQLKIFEKSRDTIFRLMAVVSTTNELEATEIKPDERTFLGLHIDSETGVVRRVGAKYAKVYLKLKPGSAELHTLVVAIEVREKGADDKKWKRGYPRSTDTGAPRKVKSRLSDKLYEKFDLRFEHGSVLRLVES